MNMAADHAIEVPVAHGVHDGVFKIKNERHRTFYASLGVARQGPVIGNAKRAPHPGNPDIDAHQEVVTDIAQHRQPAMMTRDLIKIIAMNDQITTAIGSDMNVLFGDQDVTKSDVMVLAQGFVVIAWNKHDFLAMPCAAQNLLHHGVLRGRPVNTAFHCPEVDDVAHQKELLGFVVAQKNEQSIGLATPCAQMNVGEENRAKFHAVAKAVSCLIGRKAKNQFSALLPLV